MKNALIIAAAGLLLASAATAKDESRTTRPPDRSWDADRDPQLDRPAPRGDCQGGVDCSGLDELGSPRREGPPMDGYGDPDLDRGGDGGYSPISCRGIHDPKLFPEDTLRDLARYHLAGGNAGCAEECVKTLVKNVSAPVRPKTCKERCDEAFSLRLRLCHEMGDNPAVLGPCYNDAGFAYGVCLKGCGLKR